MGAVKAAPFRERALPPNRRRRLDEFPAIKCIPIETLQSEASTEKLRYDRMLALQAQL
jgi:hypothetical protein